MRKLIGYARLETAQQLAWLNTLYTDLLRPYNNCFQPVMKLIAKERRSDGLVVKRYDVPRTPFHRVLTFGRPSPQLADLQRIYQTSNPLALKRAIDRYLAVPPATLEAPRSA